MSRTAKKCVKRSTLTSWKIANRNILPSRMPDEDKKFGGFLVLDSRKWWRYVKTIYQSNPVPSPSGLLCTPWISHPHMTSKGYLRLSCMGTRHNVCKRNTCSIVRFLFIIIPTHLIYTKASFFCVFQFLTTCQILIDLEKNK